MRVVLAASEAAPLAKTGGLGDVVGALPGALRRLGVDARVVLPGFPAARRLSGARPAELRLEVPLSGALLEAGVERGRLPDGTPVSLIRYDPFFDRAGLYGEDGRDYADNAARFAFFSRAVLALLAAERGTDVLHCHDWQSALAAALLRADAGRYPELAGVRSVLTIHNLAYQGFFWALDWHLLDLDPAYFSPRHFEFWDHIDYLKAGIVLADAITTVSPRYAEEICTVEMGHGLDGVLRERRAVLHGILNGADYTAWAPETDVHLPERYGAGDLDGKAACKRALQRELGLAVDPGTPLLAMVSRLVGQKGIDLVLEVGDQLHARPLQLAVLGSGDPALEAGLRTLAEATPERFAVRIGFDEALAHRLQGGADLLLMPSRFEPCGLNQMYALRYGTVPVVHATGGLDDTVQEFDPATEGGNGFKFRPATATALLAAIDRARGWFGRPEVWRRLIRRAMAADFSWERSARLYADLYASLSPTAKDEPQPQVRLALGLRNLKPAP